MTRRLEVQIVGSTGDLDRALGRAEKRTSSFGSKLGGLAKGGAITAAVGGVALLGKGLFDSVGAAKEAEKAQARLESALASSGVSFDKHGSAIDKAIQKTSKLAAIDDEELSDSFAKLVRTSGSVEKAMDGMSLAADIARARNISLDKATGIVEKAMIGQTRGLKSVGVELDKGMTSTQALEKAQAQFAGAAEKHGATAAGAQEKLGVAFENLQEKVGQKLLPVLAKLSTKLVEMIEWAEKNWPKFKEAAEPVFDAVKVVIDNLIDKIKAITSTIEGVVKIIRGIKNGEWSTVWDGVKQVVVDGIGGMVAAMVALPAKILLALGKAAWSGLSAIGGWIVGAIVGGLTGAAKKIGDAVTSAVSGALGRIQAIIDAVRDALSWLARLGTGNTVRDLPAPPGRQGRPVPPTSNIPPNKRARGGPVSGGNPYVVGERGPELFVPGRSGSIIPNGGARNLTSGGVIENHVHVTLDGREIFAAVQKHAARDVRVGGAGVPGVASV